MCTKLIIIAFVQSLRLLATPLYVLQSRRQRLHLFEPAIAELFTSFVQF